MVWLVLKENLLHYFHHLLFLLFLNQNCIRYSSMSRTNCFMNLLEGSFSCWLITINYIQLPTCPIWNGVIGVEGELVTLFPPSIVPAPSQPKLRTILLHVSHQLLYKSVGEIFFQLTNYHLLHTFTYLFDLKLCDWCRGGTCSITSTIYCSWSFSNKTANDTPCLTPITLQICWRDLFPVKSLPFITYTYSTCFIWNGVIVVEGELVILFPLSIVPALSQPKLHTILLHVSHQLLYESVGEIFFLLTHYHLLHTITYSFNLKWCDWCLGGNCYNISTIYCSCSFSTKTLYNTPPCLTPIVL